MGGGGGDGSMCTENSFFENGCHEGRKAVHHNIIETCLRKVSMKTSVLHFDNFKRKLIFRQQNRSHSILTHDVCI